MAGALVIDLSKGAGKRLAQAALDVAGWNDANPEHPRGPDGRWSKRVALAGETALGALPVQLSDHLGYGKLHPQYVPGQLRFHEGVDPGWSAEERRRLADAIEDYRGADFRNINRKLRGIHFEGTGGSQSDFELGVEGYHKRLDALIEDIDTVMEHSRLTHDVVVIRGTETGRGVFGDALAGNLAGFEWREDGYVSTTVNPKIADYFTISGLILEIHVPRGTRAIGLSGMRHDRGHEVVDGEAEILLEHGLKMRVISDTGPGEPRRLKVEVVQ